MSWMAKATIAVLVIFYVGVFGGASATQLAVNETCKAEAYAAVEAFKAGQRRSPATACEAAAAQAKVSGSALRSLTEK